MSAAAALDLKSSVCCWLLRSHGTSTDRWPGPCPETLILVSSHGVLIHPVHSRGFPLPDGKVPPPPTFFFWQDRELGLYLHLHEDSETHHAQIQLAGNSPPGSPHLLFTFPAAKKKVGQNATAPTVLPSRHLSLVRQGRNGKRETGNGVAEST